MKTKNNALVALLIFCATNSIAAPQGLKDISVRASSQNALALQMTNEKNTEIEVTIKDEQGVTIHQESFKQSGLVQKQYNLKALPSGNYTIVVGSDKMLKVQSFTKVDGVIKLSAEAEQTIFQPTFRKHSQFIDLNMLCNWNEKVSLSIHDSEGRLIYTEMVKPEGTLERRFNLSNLKEDSYSITVGIENQMVNQEFSELVEWTPTIAYR
jgi:biopolymer transport protein ExbD